MNEKETVYKIQDLYLASFLMARGNKLLRVEKTNNKELVNANNLIGSIRDLKSIVHNLKGEV